ncbi:sensor histidine kinase [Saccharothrix longispora]|uniref:sensor histidine kinase n=1 Tax=Saccharothrix longispora TaxID=33920 RepID=UPI0028FD01E2|nr:CHASE3 domain-containing protein [Saccharothrix longispora]MDU0288211.1 CHASE3 domain-containing protein [Saccharothrix longispora]
MSSQAVGTVPEHDADAVPPRRPGATGGWQRMTVQAWFFALLAVMGVVVVVGAVIGAEVLRHTAEVSDQQSEHIQPARAEAYRLQNAVVDQETGSRGYAITADPQFLTPYTEGVRAERESVDRLRELLVGREPLLADVTAVQEAIAGWRREYADPLIAGVVEGAPKPVDVASAERGKVAFDSLRRLFADQDEHLRQALAAGRAELLDARSARNWVLGLVVLGLGLAGIAVAVVVRVLVVRPLDQLRSTSRRVAQGEFELHIVPHGPADLRAVAEDVEAMRERIVEELAQVRVREELLVEQAAVLDARAEELRRSNGELEQFAYVASHDLQEPLRKVASFCQLLEKRYGDRLDERGVQYIGFAVDGAKRMQVLINDLLTYSRVGRVNRGKERIELDRPLDEALRNLGAAIEESGAVVERPADLPAVTGDLTLLVMLWQNLVGNAVKFHRPDQPPLVRVTCEPATLVDGSPAWELAVTDNGIGIPAEYAEKVFVIFQRLHARDTYTGTGIGLALCKKIVEHHGGAIALDTGHTEGTRIRFTLPATATGAEDAA